MLSLKLVLEKSLLVNNYIQATLALFLLLYNYYINCHIRAYTESSTSFEQSKVFKTT